MNDRFIYEAVGSDVEVSPLPSSSPDPGVRALYDSDVSTQIQQRFAAWYSDHRGHNPVNWNDSYFIVRTAQQEYIAYFGDIASDGSINDADMVVYKQVSAGGYNTAWTWTVSHVNSGSVDLAGYSGYIYSSYENYQSSPYMIEYESSIRSTFAVCGLLILALFCCLFYYIRFLFRGGR